MSQKAIGIGSAIAEATVPRMVETFLGHATDSHLGADCGARSLTQPRTPILSHFLGTRVVRRSSVPKNGAGAAVVVPLAQASPSMILVYEVQIILSPVASPGLSLLLHCALNKLPGRFEHFRNGGRVDIFHFLLQLPGGEAIGARLDVPLSGAGVDGSVGLAVVFGWPNTGDTASSSFHSDGFGVGDWPLSSCVFSLGPVSGIDAR